MNFGFSSRRRGVTYLATVLLSVLALVAGNRAAVGAGAVLPALTDPALITGRVIAITSRTVTEEPGFGPGQIITSVTLRFFVRVDDGPLQGSQLLAEQQLDDSTGGQPPEVAVGDRVVITEHPDPTAQVPYLFGDYARSRGVFILCGVFFVLLVLFGRMKGFHTIVALLFTCGAVFAVFLPAVLAGANIYLSAILVCLYIIVSTLLLVNGPTAKTLVAMTGCFAGVLAAAGLTLLESRLLKLSGMVTQDTVFLSGVGGIDLVAVVFAGITIGAVGAVMDVAVSIASALAELHEKAPALSARSLFGSGIAIGRDMMSTMSNTLVLAYIGSSLATVLLLVTYTNSLQGLLNIEMIVTELLQAIIGSMAILLTIPLTSSFAALLYTRHAPQPGGEA